MNQPKAFLFDLNGTMINDMPYHIKAWHDTLINLGSHISLEKMKEECYGKNEEILERIMPGKFNPEETAVISMTKERAYQQYYQPHVKLLPGLSRFLNLAKVHAVRMAIGSASIIWNIDFILDTLGIRHFFDTIVGAEQVQKSKPSPETFLRCAENLQTNPSDCIVFEDSTKGVESALRAGMQCVAITTLHQRHEFDPYPNVLLTVSDYTDVQLRKNFFKMEQ